MKLRPKVALTIALTAGPLIALFAWNRNAVRERAVLQVLGERLASRMRYEGGRARCEAAPGSFREASLVSAAALLADEAAYPLFAYSARFVSENPLAAPFPADMQRALATRDFVTRADTGPGSPGRLLALRMPWGEGPCAVVLARVPFGLASLGPSEAFPWVAPLLLLGVLVLAMVAGVAPVVARIRGLTVKVRESAAAGYAQSVPAAADDELGDLARAFNELGQQVREQLAALRQRDQALRAFVADTTHDVAIPLTVLQGHLVALRKQLDASQPPERLLRAIEEAHYLGGLLHNLGAAAKLQSAERDPILQYPVDLNQMVERAVARHVPIAAQREIQLDYALPAEPLVTRGDVTLIEQALSNVISNAVRYNHHGGHAAVLLDKLPPALAAGPARFSLRVIDDGPGVSDSEIPLLTERGYRHKTSSGRQSPGHGLGLHIAKDVATRHGMSLEIRRCLEGGLEVEFTGELTNDAPAALITS